MEDNMMAQSPLPSGHIPGRLSGQPQFAIEAPDTSGIPEISQDETLVSQTVSGFDQWRARLTRRLRPKRQLPRWAVITIIVALVVVVLPTLFAAGAAIRDYVTLKNLGESGMHHLLNAKDDLAGMIGGLSSNDSLSTLLTPNAAPAAPYTLNVQRQGGTDNLVNITIHPAANMPKSIKATNYQKTITTNTPLTLPASPTAPKPATPKATATATPTGTASAASTLDPSSITKALSELRAAQKDFQSLRAMLENPDPILSLAPRVPNVAGQMSTVETLANIGYDASTLGVVLATSVQPMIDRLQKASQAGTGNAELLTQSDVKGIQSGLAQGQVIFKRIEQELGTVDVSTLPISASQQAELSKVVDAMPRYESAFPQASTYIALLGWLAGADASRNFLVQTLDSGELRGTGGFEGFFSILTIDHGKVAPFKLLRANDLDYGTLGCGKGVNNWAINNPAPSAYVNWWPFANWGLRDANLNSDFPTSAKLIMNAYSHEACKNVDGVIQFTPDAISSVLQVTGPIYVPDFKETVTADNLEAKIHYYEENPAGIAKAQAIFHDSNPKDVNTIRTRFTQEVEQLLETKVRSLPKSDLVPLAKQLLTDLRAKEVQVYFNNTALESQLQKLGADGAIATTSGLDSLMVSQVNVSISKASPYIATTITDDVTLDTKGGATHRLTISLKNNAQTYTQVAGYLTYRDYVRVYVPAGATLYSADGFDQGKLMCNGPAPTPPTPPGGGNGDGNGDGGGNGGGGKPTPTPSPTPSPTPTAPTCGANPYPNGERVCPSGKYLPADEGPYILQPGSKENTLNEVGWPTATRSDVPHTTMWGGYVVIPQYCTANLWLEYYVPHVVNTAALNPPHTATPTPKTTPTNDIADPRKRRVA